MLQKCCRNAAEVQQRGISTVTGSSKAVEQQQKCSNTAGNQQFLEVISSFNGLEWARMGAGWAQARRNARGRSLSLYQQNQQYQQK